MRSPYFNSVIKRTGIPRFPETTTLRSPRDSDTVAREHLKHEQDVVNVSGLRHAVRQLQSQYNRMRMRGNGAFTRPPT